MATSPLRTSTNCLGDSSMHTTGKCSSYGCWYTSSTCSIAATKALFCSGGITHSLVFQGLSSFFLVPPGRPHARGCLRTLIPPSCLPAAVVTSVHNPAEAHCNRAVPGGLPLLHLPCAHR